MTQSICLLDNHFGFMYLYLNTKTINRRFRQGLSAHENTLISQMSNVNIVTFVQMSLPKNPPRRLNGVEIYEINLRGITNESLPRHDIHVIFNLV